MFMFALWKKKSYWLPACLPACLLDWLTDWPFNIAGERSKKSQSQTQPDDDILVRCNSLTSTHNQTSRISFVWPPRPSPHSFHQLWLPSQFPRCKCLHRCSYTCHIYVCTAASSHIAAYIGRCRLRAHLGRTKILITFSIHGSRWTCGIPIRFPETCGVNLPITAQATSRTTDSEHKNTITFVESYRL